MRPLLPWADQELSGVRNDPGEQDVEQGQPDQDERPEPVAEHRDPDQQLDQDVEADAAAATTAAAAAATAEARGAAAGGGQRGGREHQSGECDRDGDQEQPAPRHEATSARGPPAPAVRAASGPTPGSACGTCWSAW